MKDEKGKTMNLTEHFKQRLIQALKESRQSEERKLAARVGKARRGETREGDASRVIAAGLGAGTDPLNRARQRQMNAAFSNPQRRSEIPGMAKARNIRTDAGIRILGSNPNY